MIKIENDISESFVTKGFEIWTFFSSIEHLSQFGLNSSIKIRLGYIQQPFISFLSAESSQWTRVCVHVELLQQLAADQKLSLGLWLDVQQYIIFNF